jgi:hypothetical protein
VVMDHLDIDRDGEAGSWWDWWWDQRTDEEAARPATKVANTQALVTWNYTRRRELTKYLELSVCVLLIQGSSSNLLYAS